MLSDIEKIYCNIFIVSLIVLFMVMYLKKKKHVIKYRPHIAVKSNSGEMYMEPAIFEMFSNKLANDVDNIKPDKKKYPLIKKHLEKAILSTKQFIDENLKNDNTDMPDNITKEKSLLTKKFDRATERDDISEETDDIYHDDIKYKLLELSDNMSKISLILSGDSHKGMLDITDLENVINVDSKNTFESDSKKPNRDAKNTNVDSKSIFESDSKKTYKDSKSIFESNYQKPFQTHIRKCSSEAGHIIYSDKEYTNLIKDVGKHNYKKLKDKDVLSQPDNNSHDFINRHGKQLARSNYRNGSIDWSMSDRLSKSEKCSL
jgi:hypothetical protein